MHNIYYPLVAVFLLLLITAPTRFGHSSRSSSRSSQVYQCVLLMWDRFYTCMRR